MTESRSSTSLQVGHRPIDHIWAGPSRGRHLTSSVEGWDNTVDGVEVSDHSGVLANLDLSEPKDQT